jgi:ribosomal protein L3
MKAILGEKLGMTQIFKEDQAIPVTVMKARSLRKTGTRPSSSGTGT